MKSFWDMFKKVDFNAPNELQSQNQAQYRLHLKTPYTSNTLRYSTTMLKIKKKKKMVLKILIKWRKRDFLTLKSCLVRVKIENSWYQYWYFMVYYYHAESFKKKL